MEETPEQQAVENTPKEPNRKPLKRIGLIPTNDKVRNSKIRYEGKKTQEDLARVRQELAQTQEREQKAVEKTMIDPLTGLGNKLAFDRDIEQVFEETQRYEQEAAVITFDLDNFKGINDSLGHENADKVLIELSQLIPAYMRSSDRLYRRSGDEFFIITPHTSNGDTVVLANRIKDAIEKELNMTSGYPDRKFTTSMGIAGYNPTKDNNPSNVSELLERAEIALQNSKRDMDGKPVKNTVTVYTDGMVYPPGGENGRENTNG